MKLSLDNLLTGWFRLTQRYSVLLIIGILLLAALSLHYTINNLGMNTDTRDMLSPELRWRQLDLEYETLFPHTTDNLLIVLEAGTPDQAADAAFELYTLLKQEPQNYKSVYSHSQLDVFKQSSLLYLEQDELQDLADQLATNQAFLSRLIADQNLRGLSAMLEEAMQALADGEEVDLEPILEQFSAALNANQKNENFQLSWQKLLFEEDEQDVYREFIIVQPILDYSEMLPAANLLSSIRQQVDEAGIIERHHVELRFTGGVALSHEELESVMQTNTVAIIVAFIFVAIILVVGLGSGWLVLTTLFALLVGLILTAGFATLTIGELNLISVAFAVLYIGLGVDFAIHYCMRYHELLREKQDKVTAISETTRSIGAALIICSFTTAIGFYAFVPTDYDGVAELGWISGSGMFISLLITLTLIPSLLQHLPVTTARKQRPNTASFFNSIYSLPSSHGGKIRIFAVIVTLLSLLLVRHLEFDINTLNLQPPENESVKTFKDLLKAPGDSPLTGKILVNDLDDAEQTRQKLEQLSLVDKVIWLHDFIPEQQEEKLFLIDEMNLLLGGNFFTGKQVNIDTDIRHNALNSLLAAVKLHTQNGMQQFLPFQESLTAYMQFLKSVSPSNQKIHLETLEQSLLSSLPGRLRSLEAGLSGTEINLSDLPDIFIQRWVNQDKYLLEIYPVENLQENAAQYRFVEQVQASDDRVTGGPVVPVEAGIAVIQAFTQAMVSAIIVIALLLLILMPKKADALYVLAPLLLAALMTAAISVLTDTPLNFANVIALPLLLGIGVDSAIHMIHRFRTGVQGTGLLETSAARAIVISALTTIGSIGNLAFSPHVGTASMGLLLTTGIAMALLTTLFILPSLLEYNMKK